MNIGRQEFAVGNRLFVRAIHSLGIKVQALRGNPKEIGARLTDIV